LSLANTVNETATGLTLINWEDKTLSNVQTADTNLEDYDKDFRNDLIHRIEGYDK